MKTIFKMHSYESHPQGSIRPNLQPDVPAPDEQLPLPSFVPQPQWLSSDVPPLLSFLPQQASTLLPLAASGLPLLAFSSLPLVACNIQQG